MKTFEYIYGAPWKKHIHIINDPHPSFDNYINYKPYQLLLSQRFQNSIEVQLVLRTQRYSRVIYNKLFFVFDGNHYYKSSYRQVPSLKP